MQRFFVGDAVVTKISELDLDSFDPGGLLPTAPAEEIVLAAAPLSPGSYDSTKRSLRLSVHSWLVQIGGRTILIDTGVGNDKERASVPIFHHLDGPYLDRLAGAGVDPGAVDTVLITHVHADHVGWNTRLRDGHWVPTFPNARYVLSALEADYNAALAAGDSDRAAALRKTADLGPHLHEPTQTYADSIAPVEAAGLATRIPLDGREVVPGMRFVSLPGHSIDHAAIMLESSGQRALFWGDVLHHPVQVVHPEWNSVFCEFPEAAVRSRHRALELAADTGALVFSTHFAESSAGYVHRLGGGFAWHFAEAGRA